MLEKTLESPLDRKEMKPVNPKGNLSSIFIGKTDAEAPILGPPDVKRRLIRKDPDGMMQRDRMGREGGGGFRMGNTCKSMADSCRCMAETTTIL